MTVNLFIVGTTRSGTSALRNAIAETRFSGPGEGHSIGLLGAISESIGAYFKEHAEALKHGTMLADWNRNEFWKDIVGAYQKQIRLTFPGAFYVDKTPNVLPIHFAKLIESSMENVCFVFCRRRGIDNVASKRKKFPTTSFYEHCTEWTDVISAWEAQKLQLASPVLELDFYELFSSPELLSIRISEFLGLPEDERALFLRHLLDNQPNSAPWSPLDSTGWSAEEHDMFRSVCGPTMTKFGYGSDTYWESTPRLRD